MTMMMVIQQVTERCCVVLRGEGRGLRKLSDLVLSFFIFFLRIPYESQLDLQLLYLQQTSFSQVLVSQGQLHISRLFS